MTGGGGGCSSVGTVMNIYVTGDGGMHFSQQSDEHICDWGWGMQFTQQGDGIACTKPQI